MKKRKNSRAKGCNFELQVAKLVQAWYGGTWKRTPLSGGWSKGKGDFDVAGDLVCDLKHRLHVECKFHNKFYVEDLITGIRARGTTSILMWWEQATREAAKSYGEKPRNPLLIFKRNLGPVCIMMTEKFFNRLDKLGGGLGTLLPQLRHRIETGKYGNGPVVIMSADVFFARMRPPKASPNHATWVPKDLKR